MPGISTTTPTGTLAADRALPSGQTVGVMATAHLRGPRRLSGTHARSVLPTLPAILPRDARRYQIVTLAVLLGYGMVGLGLDVGLPQAAVTLAAVQGTQILATWLVGAWRFDPWSALISGLSLCLLLRTESLGLAAVAAALAIASKFVLRVRDKHVFNPTNFAIVAMLLLTDRVWVSPGQWGSTATFAFLLGAAGGLVVNRAARADVTLAFLATHALLLLGRSWWLGEPWATPFHRLESGALVLFAFFMISDPRTTPDSRRGRLLFAIVVALGAYWVQFKLFRPNGLLWSLAASSVAVPIVDRILPGPRYAWLPDRLPRRTRP